MKLWLLTTEYPPMHGGGISTYGYHTAHMFAEQGHDVTVWVADKSLKAGMEESVPAKGIRLIRFYPGTLPCYKFLGYETALGYEFAELIGQKIAKYGAPDLIECQDYLGIGYYFLLRSYTDKPELRKIPFLLTLHAPSFLYLRANQVPVYKFPEFWIGEMELFGLQASDALISPSRFLVEALEGRADRSEVVANPFRADALDLPHPIIRNSMLFFGKMTIQKGLPNLLGLFRKLWEEGFEHPLHVIGGGDIYFYPLQKDMVDHVKQKYAPEIGSGKLKLLGQLPPADWEKQLRSAHVILIPSTVDNYPYAVLEAMALGKVVLASVHGGQNEMIEDGKSGFLFSFDEEGSFESKLKHILSLPDEELIRIGNVAAERVKQLTSYDVIYPKKMAVIERAINNHPTPKNRFPFIRPLKPQSKPIATGIPTLLSVVVPFYNMGNWVEDALDSIMKSDYTPLEIIVVDDGSTDKQSLLVLGKLSEKYPVSVIRQPNQGLAAARNTGAKAAKGEFLAFLDPDDTIAASYFSKAIRILKQYNNVSFVGCWAQYFEGSDAVWPAFTPEPPYVLVHNTINSSALVYKKADFLAAGLNKPIMEYGMEDYESVVSMLDAGFGGVAIPDALWNYRVRKNSMARAFNRFNQLHLYRLITELHPDLYQQYGAEVFNLLNHNGPGYEYDNPTFDRKMTFGAISPGMIAFIKKNPILRAVGKMVVKWVR